MESILSHGGRSLVILSSLILLVPVSASAQSRPARPTRATPGTPATRPSKLPTKPSGTARLVPTNDGQTVYDPSQNVTWLANANLAAGQKFGVRTINANGSMDYATAVQWVDSMNAYNHGAGYLGHKNWTLPTTPPSDSTCSSHHVNSFGFRCRNSALGSLFYKALGLPEPNTAVPIGENTVGPFRNFQPYLYW